jgi:hypothetical protein
MDEHIGDLAAIENAVRHKALADPESRTSGAMSFERVAGLASLSFRPSSPPGSRT